jgi:SAM-dependent methyltransferase
VLTIDQTPVSGARWALLDRYLTEAVVELFGHDDRLRGSAVQVRFDRGVAHLSGAVAAAGELLLVRQLVGRLEGVLGVWSRVRVAGRAPTIVDLGCGRTKQYPDNIGLDMRSSPAVDVVTDLRVGLPIADRSVDVAFAVHVLEHLGDFLCLIDECHRVLRADGVLHVICPWWRFVNAVADPTHVRFIDVQTIKGVCDRFDGSPRWYPLHAACDGASVFADLTPLAADEPGPDPDYLARFFD